jgi:hypothetical protein
MEHCAYSQQYPWIQKGWDSPCGDETFPDFNKYIHHLTATKSWWHKTYQSKNMIFVGSVLLKCKMLKYFHCLRVHHRPQFNKMCVRVHFHLWPQHSNLRAKDKRTVLHHWQSIPINSLSKVKLHLAHTKWNHTEEEPCLFKDAIYSTICCHVGSLCVEKLAITKPATI